jgi:hypothetical protein
MNTTTEYKPRGSRVDMEGCAAYYQNLYEKKRDILNKLLDIYDLTDIDQIVDYAKEYKEEHEQMTEKLDKIYYLLQ